MCGRGACVRYNLGFSATCHPTAYILCSLNFIFKTRSKLKMRKLRILFYGIRLHM